TRLDFERRGERAAPLRARHRLEHLVRGGGRTARRPDASVRARTPVRGQRLLGVDVRGRARAPGRADARDAGGRRDGRRRHDRRDPPGAVDFRAAAPRSPRRGLIRLHLAAGGRRFAVSLRMKTYNAKPGEIAREWYVVDADGKTLGRLATAIADTLR